MRGGQKTAGKGEDRGRCRICRAAGEAQGRVEQGQGRGEGQGEGGSRVGKGGRA